jgi:hypothetical protein
MLDLSEATIWADVEPLEVALLTADHDPSHETTRKLYALQVYVFAGDVGPSGLLLVKDGDYYRRVGVFTFGPPDEDEIRDLRTYEEISDLADERLSVQRDAFRHTETCVIEIR